MEFKELLKLCQMLQPLFYVSDDELSPQNMPDASDEVDRSTTTTSASASSAAYFMPTAMDDSNGSLNSRFDRQVQVKSSRVYSSHKSRRKDRSRSKSRHRSGGHLEDENLVRTDSAEKE